ncbi:MAG: HNH endonuclease [Gemmataceae bacterium]|nr:HNH endonuclease [Gemmataceae bacterium]
MPRHESWTRDQLLMALRLYFRLPFGKLHKSNVEIVRLAKQIGRTPSALAMKACNFANLDPNIKQKGLSGASRADAAIWDEFHSNPTGLALEAEEAAARFHAMGEDAEPISLEMPTGPTERDSIVRVRRVQSFFRAAVLTSYNGRCAISGITGPEMVIASHIVPWSESEKRRADPTNGLCLNTLFDRAFDRLLISVDEDGKVLVSPRLRERVHGASLGCDLIAAEGRQLIRPSRFAPDPSALAEHRARFFAAIT